MVLKEDQAKVKALLTEAITVLCKNGLTYRAEFSVEGLLGITLDNDEVFLISINETIRGDFPGGQGMTPTPPKAMPPMMQQRGHMSAPPKPMGRGRGMPAGRGRAAVVNRKRSLEPDFKQQQTMSGSAPGTPTHPSPHSSMGSPPGTPGTPQQHQGLDPDQPPIKRPHEADGEDLALEDGHAKIKSEPGTGDATAAGDWDPPLGGQDQQTDPNAMQMPSFGDELQLGGGMDQMNQNVKMEQGLQQPAGTGPGMERFRPWRMPNLLAAAVVAGRPPWKVPGNVSEMKVSSTVSTPSVAEDQSRARIPNTRDTKVPEPDEGDDPETRTYKCNICGKSYRGNSGLKVHMMFHTGRFPFWCSECQKGFTCKGNYEYHIAKHEGRSYPCDLCVKRFQSKQNLMRHKVKDHGKM